MKLKTILFSMIILGIAFLICNIINQYSLWLGILIPFIVFIISFLILNKIEKFKSPITYNNDMGKISLTKLRKQVAKLEKENKQTEEIIKLQKATDDERSSLNSKLKRLKKSRTPLGKLRKKASVIAKRSKPLAIRLKRAIDRAAMQQ